MKVMFSGAEDEHLNQFPMCISADVLEKESITNLNDVVAYVYRTEPRAHRSFFKQDGGLEDGVICLLDEQHSEVLTTDEQAVNSNTSVVFISTMHGG